LRLCPLDTGANLRPHGVFPAKEPLGAAPMLLPLMDAALAQQFTVLAQLWAQAAFGAACQEATVTPKCGLSREHSDSG